jgi:hypothetical protein
MRIFLLPLRHHLDLYRTALSGHPRYHGGVVCLFLGLAALMATPVRFDVAGGITAVSMVLSVVLLLPDWWAARRASVELITPRAPADLTAPDPGPLRYLRWQGHVAAVDAEVDRLLPRGRAIARWKARPSTLPDGLTPLIRAVLRERLTSTSVFNGTLIRQNTDLTPQIARDGDVELSRTTYFRLLVTNYMMSTVVVRRDTGACALRPEQVITDADGRLMPLSRSLMANPIGVSTVAFTSDRRVVLVVQSAQCESSRGRFAPSGSGSLDMRDVRCLRRRHASEHPILLREVIAAGMERELCEEAVLRPEEIEETSVLGWFRWMDKGAKPEFVGFTRLRITSGDLSRRAIRLDERPYVKGTCVEARLDLVALRELARTALSRGTEEDLDATMACLDLPTGSPAPSFPLVMCVRALGRALAREGEPFPLHHLVGLPMNTAGGHKEGLGPPHPAAGDDGDLPASPSL